MNYGKVKTTQREVEDLTLEYIWFFQEIGKILFDPRLQMYVSDEIKDKFINFLTNLEEQNFKIFMYK